MGYTEDLLASVRKQIDAHPVALAEARSRTALVRWLGERDLPGTLRSFGSGSLEHHTQNHPIGDGDAGLVLDRRCYPALGPEGGGQPPTQVAEELRALLGPAVRQTYPKAKVWMSKRGPMVRFHQAADDQDPTVDIVVALTRREGSGLWIPNLDKGTWEPSHPERHRDLLNGDPAALRSTRRKVIRLLKAWNKQFTHPCFSSFHLSVLALEFVVAGHGVARSLHAVLAATAARMAAHGATKDPAGVSANIRLLGSWDDAERRTRIAAGHLARALDNDNDEAAVRAALSSVFHRYLDSDDALSGYAAVLGGAAPIPTAALGLGGGGLVVATRAYGQHPGQVQPRQQGKGSGSADGGPRGRGARRG